MSPTFAGSFESNWIRKAVFLLSQFSLPVFGFALMDVGTQFGASQLAVLVKISTPLQGIVLKFG